MPPHPLRVAMTIAGSDPSGGAGLQADLKTFHQRGVYGTSVVTLITVQNTLSVDRVEPLPTDLVTDQIDAVLGDIPPDAAKTGALGNSSIIEAIAARAAGFHFPLVVDPVMISKHGAPLLDPEARTALRDRLLPVATLVTPNLHEASMLAEMKVEDPATMEEAAIKIVRLGAQAALIKGGHLAGEAVDVLCHEGQIFRFSAPRISSRHTHGTGCTFSAAITAELAGGRPLPEAVQTAKRFISRAIREHPSLGRGIGPVSTHVNLDE